MQVLVPTVVPLSLPPHRAWTLITDFNVCKVHRPSTLQDRYIALPLCFQGICEVHLLWHSQLVKVQAEFRFQGFNYRTLGKILNLSQSQLLFSTMVSKSQGV